MKALNWLRQHGGMAYSAVSPIWEPAKDIALAVLDAVGYASFYVIESFVSVIGGVLRLVTKREFWLVVLGFLIAQAMLVGQRIYQSVLDDYDAKINKVVSYELPLPIQPESAPYSEDELYCLARVVYGEAKGESERGKHLVAMVVINRAISGGYPADVCKVVNEDQQFHGYTAAMNLAVRADFDAFLESYTVARDTFNDYVYEPTTEKNILWFHAEYVRPSWAKGMERAFVEGRHIFYREGPPPD